MRRARAGVAAIGLGTSALALAGGCSGLAASSGGDRAASGSDARPAASRDVISALTPARYFVASEDWVERSPEGLDRVVANGCRVEARGPVMEQGAACEPAITGGAAAPSWVSGPPGTLAPRYLFWSEKTLYKAATFLGELTKITATAGDIRRAFDWVDGTGIITAAGTLLARGGGAVEPFPLPGVVEAAAADSKRGLALTIFGHAWLTLDGGAGFQDRSAELGEARGVEVRGDELIIVRDGERRTFIGASGAITETSAGRGVKRGVRPPELDERWPASLGIDPLSAAASEGIPVGGGEVIVALSGRVARLDIRSGKVVSSAEVTEAGVSCAPIRVPDAILLACESKESAAVIDVTGAPRVERTWSLVDAADYDKFAGVDGEALGFVGPCGGGGPKPSDLDVLTSASPYNTSTQRSGVFCARAGRDLWIEHHLDPADEADVIAWIPRAGGEAAAIVARRETFLRDGERVSVRGKLRTVRVARGEPPLSLPAYNNRSSVPLSRSARALPDGSIEAWLPTSSYPRSTVAVSIDPEGRARVRPIPPRAETLTAFGAFAIAQAEDGELFETIDWGKRWLAVDPPPGMRPPLVSSCSAAGCRLGPFVRIGWTSGEPGAASKAVDVFAPAQDRPTDPASGAARMRFYGSTLSAAPVVRLRCAPSSRGEGARFADSYSFGFTSSPAPRTTGFSRMGRSGAALIPWSGPPAPVTGDAELAWLSPLDIEARVRRATVPLSSANVDVKYRPYEIRLGHVINGEGRVDAIAVGAKDACFAPVLEQAGVVRPVGGCAPESSIGVDLGSKIVLHSDLYGSRTISVVDLVTASGSKGASSPAGAPAAIGMRELSTASAPRSAVSYAFAVGSRGGAPVVIAVDASGRAVLSPIDPETGALRAEETMADLSSAALGDDPRCAPAPEDARVLLPFDGEIGLDSRTLTGVSASDLGGLAVLRWSRSRVCLDAIEIAVRDERYELDLSRYDPPGTARRLVARFSPKSATPPRRLSPAEGASGTSADRAPGLPAGTGNGSLALVMFGAEIRQRLSCEGIGP